MPRIRHKEPQALMHPVADADPSQQLTSHEVLYKELLQLPHVTENALASTSDDGETKISAFPAMGAMERVVAQNKHEGIEQSLVAIVNAGGDELFGVVRADVNDGSGAGERQGFILTRFAKEGERDRATVVGEISATEGLVVGRSHQPDLRDAGSVSRQHFQVFLNPQRTSFLIADLGSSNGTSVLRAKSGKELPEDTPLADINKWAPKSADVKRVIAPDAPETGVRSAIKERVEASGDFIAEVPKELRGSIGGVAVAQAVPEAGQKADQAAEAERILYDIQRQIGPENFRHLAAYVQARDEKDLAMKSNAGDWSIDAGQRMGQAQRRFSVEVPQELLNKAYEVWKLYGIGERILLHPDERSIQDDPIEAAYPYRPEK